MLITVLCILIGIPLGFIFRNNKHVVSNVNRLTMWAIYVLLFMLGVTTGSNKTIVSELGTIGVQAACISVFCVLGSACAVFLLDKLFLKGKLDER
ncbi:LysO family transporter [Halodesulfovibrio spirochaetisodalis]|uniref:LysO family transporter n=1 Tax=Halodesulfovibrio spirochaetisodalis TaxID=1560234 RepID=UPI00082CF834|nr:LysO family transporter [Halodesulfovibrio spirochaetisodalis]